VQNKRDSNYDDFPDRTNTKSKTYKIKTKQTKTKNFSYKLRSHTNKAELSDVKNSNLSINHSQASNKESRRSKLKRNTKK